MGLSFAAAREEGTRGFAPEVVAVRRSLWAALRGLPDVDIAYIHQAELRRSLETAIVCIEVNDGSPGQARSTAWDVFHGREWTLGTLGQPARFDQSGVALVIPWTSQLLLQEYVQLRHHHTTWTICRLSSPHRSQGEYCVAAFIPFTHESDNPP